MEDRGDIGIEMVEYHDVDEAEEVEERDPVREVKEMSYDEKLEESRMANLNAVVTAR